MIDFSAFVDEMCKLGARSYMDDFMGGVDPTGTKTFQYGMDDAQRGTHSGLRQAVGTAGGLVGGATIVPSVVSSVLEGAKGYRGGGWRGALVGAARGTYKPFQDLYRAARGVRSLSRARAGKALSQGELTGLQRLAKSSGPEAGAAASRVTRSNEAMQGALRHPRGSEMLGRAQEQLRSKVTDTGAAIGLSGALGAASAGMQYGKGGKVGRDLPPRPAKPAMPKPTAKV